MMNKEIPAGFRPDKKFYVDSPLGLLEAVYDSEGLKGLGVVNFGPADGSFSDHDELEVRLKEELGLYFSGKLEKFTIPLNPQGTPFQKKVWKELLKVPFGQTITYGGLGNRLNKDGKGNRYARAVGGAVNKNPILILIPCHRVVAVNGLGGFSCGVEMKLKLLAVEKRG